MLAASKTGGWWCLERGEGERREADGGDSGREGAQESYSTTQLQWTLPPKIELPVPARMFVCLSIHPSTKMMIMIQTHVHTKLRMLYLNLP